MENLDSRTYLDFESIEDALNGICQLYEQGLKTLNPDIRNITYDIHDIYTYIDELGDLCVMQYSHDNEYKAFGKSITKKWLFEHLSQQVGIR